MIDPPPFPLPIEPDEWIEDWLEGEREAYDTEVEARSPETVISETTPRPAAMPALAKEKTKSPLTARGDRQAFDRICLTGRFAGANPAAPTYAYEILPLAEFKRYSKLCERCLTRRTRWLFSRSGFVKWRHCFKCQTTLERYAISLFSEGGRGKVS
jgi:hypothetical protein